MKKISFLMVLITFAFNAHAQYDSALRYRRIATPFSVAVKNVLDEMYINNSNDTGEGTKPIHLTIAKLRSSRIANRLPRQYPHKIPQYYLF